MSITSSNPKYSGEVNYFSGFYGTLIVATCPFITTIFHLRSALPFYSFDKNSRIDRHQEPRRSRMEYYVLNYAKKQPWREASKLIDYGFQYARRNTSVE